MFMRKLSSLITSTAIILILGACANSSPQFSATDLPQYTKLTEDEIKHLQNRGFGPTVANDLSTTNDFEDISAASSQQRPVAYADAENIPQFFIQNAIPIRETKSQLLREHQQAQQQNQQVQQAARPRYNQQQQAQNQKYRQNAQALLREEEQKESEEEIEEPDRLSLLLPQSKFSCSDRSTGYYADEGLGCEVFHYCQDNAKHSWICPEGFTFHQVHLICMPPSTENICEKSSSYHFINDYLYKPVNLEEHQQQPNISLRYSERYYPDSYNHYNDNDNDEEDEPRANQHRNSVRVRDQDGHVATFRPETTQGQVFRSPNEVNIPLHQRRPQYAPQRYLKK